MKCFNCGYEASTDGSCPTCGVPIDNSAVGMELNIDYDERYY
jgi:hypothetical protein